MERVRSYRAGIHRAENMLGTRGYGSVQAPDHLKRSLVTCAPPRSGPVHKGAQCRRGGRVLCPPA